MNTPPPGRPDACVKLTYRRSAYRLKDGTPVLCGTYVTQFLGPAAAAPKHIHLVAYHSQPDTRAIRARFEHTHVAIDCGDGAGERYVLTYPGLGDWLKKAGILPSTPRRSAVWLTVFTRNPKRALRKRPSTAKRLRKPKKTGSD